MALFVRLLPDKLGRPDRLWLNAQARRILEATPRVNLQLDGDVLTIVPDPMGEYRVWSTGEIPVGRVLDQLNDQKPLTTGRLLTRRQGRELVVNLRESDADLGNAGDRLTMPMQVVPLRRGLSQLAFVRLFALYELATGEEVTEDALKNPDDLLQQLPRLESIQSRFGSVKRLRAFIDVQKSKRTMQALSREEAHEQLLDGLTDGD